MRLTHATALLLLCLVATQAVRAENRIGLYGTVCNSEEETIALIARCKANGIGTLLPSLSGGGTVIWKTDKAQYYPPLKEKIDAGYDALASLIKHAHAAGIRVIPSIAIGPGGWMIDRHPEWETRDRNGRPSSETTTPSFSFAFPEARAQKIALLMDLVNGYEVDGILLDYCRYPENSKTPESRYGFYGYDQPLIEVCRSIYGFDPGAEPIDSPKWKIFNSLRKEAVTCFVSEFRDAIKACGKPVLLTGFGDTNPQLEADSCGRDWSAWGRRGLIEEFYLATYTEKGEAMTAAVVEARKALGDKVKIHAAISPFNGFIKTPAEMFAAARALQAGKTDGIWIYREDYLTQQNLWESTRRVNEMLARNIEDNQ